MLVRVSDTGPGIAESELERVFEEFYQVGNPSRDRSQGLGLGLAIVKRTAVLLGASLRLESPPGQGATFELSLPAATAATPSPAPPPLRISSDLGPLSVLLVDDEAALLTALCTYLQQLGWQARGVSSGTEALQMLNDGFRADVVMIDYRLRDETGVDVMTRLRAAHGDLRVVIVTGDTAATRLRELSALGVMVLHKPVDGERLARALLDTVQHQPAAASA